MLYFILFLHQTTTRFGVAEFVTGCISFSFYIKPQRLYVCARFLSVVFHSLFTSNHNTAQVYLLNVLVVFHSLFTSNHNRLSVDTRPKRVVFHSLFTSNHNRLYLKSNDESVVFHSLFTSNHNQRANLIFKLLLYFILFLHQTTTDFVNDLIRD